jgi:hypothetical protein
MGFPAAVYRDGSEFDWDGRPTDRRVVHNADELERALAEGWAPPCDYAASEPKAGSLLDNSAKVIEAALPSLSLDELEKLKADEITGKTRKGVMAMIDAAIDQRLAG